ncbi:MAG: MBL fold metallo-hydrolase [Planctomycetes bacterium]|nr:MBL fold metallo-hydrolase [Planctomycetota bacterium]
MPELLFHGAAGEVTGSMHLIHVEGRWVALDCGLYQGRREESEAKNRQWPMPAREIDAVILSHAHTDHSGRLPKLAADGFDGPIFCTPATRDLSAIMLPDSAHIQQEDSEYVNKKRRRNNLPPIEPLYDYNDAIKSVRLMQTISYERPFQVVPGLSASFHEAGHMLGSAGIRVEFANRNGGPKTLYFTGDVGRNNAPILRDPAPLPSCDVIISESTYGGRVNEPVGDARQIMLDVMKRTFERGGKVIIPAFSVGRTQTIVYSLHQMMAAGALPRHPVFIDSPLAVNATDVFKMHPECYDSEAREFRRKNGDILGGDCCTYIRDVEESKALHRRRSPCTIISASGMCEAGRIRHHIKNNVASPRNTILFPGYQAQNTLGRRLVDGTKEITLFHETLPVRAEVVQIHGFSGHADQADLLRLLSPHARSARRVFLVHGEPEQAAALAAKLDEAGFTGVSRPARGQRFVLGD